MAICDDCEQEMLVATSCVVTELHIDGEAFPLVRWGAERYWPKATGRCGDCGVQPGGAHHLGCDIAECPRCRRQLLSCGCPFDEFPSEGYDDGDEDARSCPTGCWPTSWSAGPGDRQQGRTVRSWCIFGVWA